MLIYGGIANEESIYDKFITYFCDNLSHQLENWPNIFEKLSNPHYDYNLYLYGKLLKELEKTLEQKY